MYTARWQRKRQCENLMMSAELRIVAVRAANVAAAIFPNATAARRKVAKTALHGASHHAAKDTEPNQIRLHAILSVTCTFVCGVRVLFAPQLLRLR